MPLSEKFVILYLGKDQEQMARIRQMLQEESDLSDLSLLIKAQSPRLRVGGPGQAGSDTGNGHRDHSSIQYGWNTGQQSWTEVQETEWPTKMAGIGVPILWEAGATQREITGLLIKLSPNMVIVETDHAQASRLAFCQRLHSQPFGPMVVATGSQPFRQQRSVCHFYLKSPVSRIGLHRMVNRFVERWESPMRRYGSFQLHMTQRHLLFPGGKLNLSPKLAGLLAVLMEAQGGVVSRRTLMRRVWGEADPRDTRTLDVHIRWLRKALADSGEEQCYIETVRSEGYRLVTTQPVM